LVLVLVEAEQVEGRQRQHLHLVCLDNLPQFNTDLHLLVLLKAFLKVLHYHHLVLVLLDLDKELVKHLFNHNHQ
jgi:hypothetical protein